jgi:serine/threonine-protein kinase
VDWKPVFAAAGLDATQLKSADPARLSLAAFDERAAWTGTWPGSDLPLRVEAAAWRGKPVYFDLIGPWSAPRRSPHESKSAGQRLSQIIAVVMIISILAGGVLTALRNYALGKSDVRGAFRLATAVFVIAMALWVCLNHYVPTLATFAHFIIALSTSLFISAATWMFYVGLEPFVRRRWPHAIISWTRLLAGDLSDPLVGRDLLWGSLLGVLWAIIVGVGFLFLKHEGATPQLPNAELLMGTRQLLGSGIQNIGVCIIGTLEFFFLIFLLRVVLRNQWLALAGFIAIYTAINTLQSDHPQIMWPVWLLVYSLAAGAVSRFGLIVLATALFTGDTLLNLPYSLDFSTWYSAHAVAMVAVCLALAAWGFYTSLGGQKVWKDDLLD